MNSRNSRQKNPDVATKPGSSSFTYQCMSSFDKLKKYTKDKEIEKSSQNVSNQQKKDTVENFNDFLNSAEQIQRDRAKRKKQNMNTLQQVLSNKQNKLSNEPTKLPLSSLNSTDNLAEQHTKCITER